MKAVRIILWALVAVAAAGLLFLWLRSPDASPTSQMTTSKVDFGAPFTLVDSNGQPFPSSRLAGKPYAIFFGFTHCPDVCPATLGRLVSLRDRLGEGADAFNIVFVTVDPERDGPAEVGKYAELFDSPIIGLTGSPAQIEQVKKAYGIHSEKVPTESGDYTVDHTASVLLFDRKGEFVSTLSPQEQDRPAIDKLKRLVG